MPSRKWIDTDELELEFNKSLEDDKATDELKKMLLLMTEMISIKIIYLYRDLRSHDLCINITYEYMLDNWKNFNKSKNPKAFSYYAEVIKRILIKSSKDPYFMINKRRTKLIDRMLQ